MVWNITLIVSTIIFNLRKFKEAMCALGKIKLKKVNWIIPGKYTYCAQGRTIPDSFAKKVRRLAYGVKVRDRRKGIPWSQMVLPKA